MSYFNVCVWFLLSLFAALPSMESDVSADVRMSYLHAGIVAAYDNPRFNPRSLNGSVVRLFGRELVRVGTPSYVVDFDRKTGHVFEYRITDRDLKRSFVQISPMSSAERKKLQFVPDSRLVIDEFLSYLVSSPYYSLFGLSDIDLDWAKAEIKRDGSVYDIEVRRVRDGICFVDEKCLFSFSRNDGGGGISLVSYCGCIVHGIKFTEELARGLDVAFVLSLSSKLGDELPALIPDDFRDNANRRGYALSSVQLEDVGYIHKSDIIAKHGFRELDLNGEVICVVNRVVRIVVDPVSGKKVAFGELYYRLNGNRLEPYFFVRYDR